MKRPIGITFFLIMIAFISSPLFAQGAGKALSFDGTDDYVDIDGLDNDPIWSSGSITISIEAWIKPSSDKTGRQTVFATSSTEDRRRPSTIYYVHTDHTVSSTNRVNAAWLQGTDGSADSYWATDNNSVSFSGWNHIVWQISGNGPTSANVTIYINGVQQTVTNALDQGGTDFPAGDHIGIGSMYKCDDAAGTQNCRQIYYYKDIIDEVRVWNVALPADTIRKYMCRKVTSSHGYWSNLKGYWRMDDGSGQTVDDLTSNNNDGTLGSSSGTDDSDPTWVTSGAALGDASSHDYTGSSNSDFTANIAHTDGDDITATGDGGTVTGIQVYRVDEAPNVTTPPTNWDKIDPLRYWGVFIVGSSSPTYTVTYNYDGHPGITTESTLELAYRANNSTTSWTDLGATLDEGANTLTKTAQSGTEYILGTTSSDNSLPVELTSFTARQEGSAVVLEWVTESEVENLGFILERRDSKLEIRNWEEIASYITDSRLQGQGSVTHRTEYSYTDNTVEAGRTYEYHLADVSYNGKVEYHALTTLTVEEFEPVPDRFTVYQNYPNPFNAQTTISYYLPHESYVTVSVYDITGRKLETLVSGRVVSGRHEVRWDASNVASGIYIYRISMESFGETEYAKAVKKLILLK